jgi:cell pole-organizing protein PopZ
MMNKKVASYAANASHAISDDHEEDRRFREPSIEELLASIRRIISEENGLLDAASAAKDALSQEDDAYFDDHLVSDQELAETATPKDDLRNAPPRRKFYPSERGAPSRQIWTGSDVDETSATMVSDKTAELVGDHFAALAASQILQDDTRVNLLVSELLRPMLGAWLDRHLPVIVENLVREEIERVTRR